MNKTNLIHRAVCWAMATALAMLPTLAQGSRQVVTTPDGKSFGVSSNQPNVHWEQKGNAFIQRPSLQPRKAEATEETVNVTLKLDLDAKLDNPVYPYQTFILDENLEYCGKEFYSDEEVVVSLRPGVYDFMRSAFSGQDYYCVLKEEIEISHDTTIVFSIVEATNTIKYVDQTPNGEAFEYGVNIICLEIINYLVRNDDKGYIQLTGGDMFFVGRAPVIYINDVSDRFSDIYARLYITDDDAPQQIGYAICDATENVNDFLNTPIEHNTDNYTCFEDNFSPQKYSIENADFVGNGVSLRLLAGNKHLTSLGLWPYYHDKENGYHVTIYADLPEIDEDTPGLCALVSSKPIPYGYYNVIVPGIIEIPYSGDWRLPHMNLEKNIIYNNGLGGMETFFYASPNPDYYGLYFDGCEYPYFTQTTPHPFHFNLSQKKQDWGEGVPLLQYYESTHPLFNHWYIYKFIGRYGEDRTPTDDQFADFRLYKSGELMYEAKLNQYLPKRDELEPNEISEEVIEFKDIIVDGLQGKNLTTIHYDERLEDNVAPTLTMLWFKNTSNDVTERFASAEEGLLEFTASNYITHVNEERGNRWITHQTCDVEVSYSPYQEDVWNGLEMEEVPEYFCSPGYGYFYRGSLAGVTGQAEKGWFDLKIRLEDAAGNWQEQIISPAFRIDNLAYTSVANITPTNQNNDKTIYNLAGQRMNGDLDALPHGIYIVGGKKVVK